MSDEQRHRGPSVDWFGVLVVILGALMIGQCSCAAPAHAEASDVDCEEAPCVRSEPAAKPLSDLGPGSLSGGNHVVAARGAEIIALPNGDFQCRPVPTLAPDENGDVTCVCPAAPKPARKKRDRHCFPVNCRTTNEAECDPCAETLRKGNTCFTTDTPRPHCIEVCDEFCVRGVLKRAEP